ncbi:hypothetical protein AB0395_45505 [Streptosporangium sp. NPDC051023]|uniref:hypothetical protein n=1 Tax=Streptosporangium sp. NPDC051023 TaxID=3155410 RepID=UPI00344EB930
MRTLRRQRSPRRDRQPKRHSPLKALLLSAGMGFVLVAGIGVIGDRISRAHNAVRASTPAPSATTLTGPAGVPSPTGPLTVPSPGRRETRALLAALREIDPALDRRRSIGRALNSCRDLMSGMDRARVTARVRLRFDDTAPIGARQADRILTAIEDTFCSS